MRWHGCRGDALEVVAARSAPHGGAAPAAAAASPLAVEDVTLELPPALLHGLCGEPGRKKGVID